MKKLNTVVQTTDDNQFLFRRTIKAYRQFEKKQGKRNQKHGELDKKEKWKKTDFEQEEKLWEERETDINKVREALYLDTMAYNCRENCMIVGIGTIKELVAKYA